MFRPAENALAALAAHHRAEFSAPHHQPAFLRFLLFYSLFFEMAMKGFPTNRLLKSKGDVFGVAAKSRCAFSQEGLLKPKSRCVSHIDRCVSHALYSLWTQQHASLLLPSKHVWNFGNCTVKSEETMLTFFCPSSEIWQEDWHFCHSPESLISHQPAH